MEIMLIYMVSWPLATAYITCEIGERLNTEFMEVFQLIEQLKWYLFPTKVRKLLPFIMISVQEPVNIECFASISCCRDTFKRVS